MNHLDTKNIQLQVKLALPFNEDTLEDEAQRHPCSNCDFVTQTEYELNDHVLVTHIPSPATPIVTTEEPEISKVISNILHTTGEKLCFNGDSCSVAFSTEIDLHHHKENVHIHKDPDVCSQSSKNKPELNA